MRETGVVRWFDRTKGYGFIIPDDPATTNGREVYVHWSKLVGCAHKVQLAVSGDEVERSWVEAGERVEYILADTPRGPSGLDVTVKGDKPKIVGVHKFEDKRRTNHLFIFDEADAIPEDVWDEFALTGKL
jgi:cold shock CspA family protein